MVALRCPISAPESPANKGCDERKKERERRRRRRKEREKETMAVEMECFFVS